VGVPLARIVEADPLPDRHERRRKVSAKDPLLDLLGVARRRRTMYIATFP
jgi:hypothetical protein